MHVHVLPLLAGLDTAHSEGEGLERVDHRVLRDACLGVALKVAVNIGAG